MKTRLRGYLTLVVLLAVTGSAPLFSQQNVATLLGRVTDPSGAVITGTTIVVANVETGVEATSRTNEAGNYAVPSLPPGTYRVSVESSGFKRAESEIVLQIQQQRRLDISLELGQLTETVSVSAEAPLLVTDDTTLGQVVNNRKVVELPIARRNLSALTLLMPGASTSRNGIDNVLSRILTAGTAMSANGMRTSANTYTVDGASVNIAMYNYPSFVPVVDSVQEFKVRTGNYGAEFGGYGGAHIDYSLKSGANNFHATLWEFFRNDALDARNAFATGSKPVLRQNQYGAMVSGPIVRNKTFFMTTYQGYRRRQQRILQGTVPTAALRSGDLTVDTRGRPIKPFNDPLSGQPFPNNQIPSSRFSDTMQRAVEFYPLPNQSGGVNYRNLVPVPRDEDMALGKVDHVFNDNNRLSVRYVYEESEETGTLPLIADFGSIVPTRTQNVVIADTHTFSPTIFMDLRVSWNRSFIQQLTPRNLDDNDADVRSVLNMIIPSSAVPGAIENGYPRMATTGFAPLGDRTGGSPLLQPDDGYSISGAGTVIRGNHRLKMGAEFRRTRSVRFRSQNNNGTLNYQPNNVAGSGEPFADFLLGLPRSTVINLTPMTVDMLQTFTHFFFSDDWNVTPKLTMNLGLRYELDFPLNEPYGRIPFLNLTPPGSVVENEPGAPLFISDYNNFAPRIGIAYRPIDKTVIRAGYGVFYSEAPWLFLNTKVLNPPAFVIQNFFATREQALVAHDPFPLGQSAVGGVPAPRGFQTDRRTPYVQTWSLNIQRSLADDLVFEAGYVGNHGLKMFRRVSLNIPLPGSGNIQARRPLQNFGPIRYHMGDSNSNYHGLQTRLEKRFSGGLSFLGAYTFMRATDLSGNELTGGTIDPRDLNRDRSLSDTHLKHRLSVSYVYELPFGPGKRFLNTGGVAGQVLGGWQLSGVTVYESGRPLTASAPGDSGNVGIGSRPDRICDGNLDSGTTGQWFDTSCFVAPQQFTFGNSGRNILLGPGFNAWDIGIMKRFRITEQHFLQFRAEMFNAFNEVNLGNPGTRINTPAFGRITSTGVNDARTIQFGLKYGF